MSLPRRRSGEIKVHGEHACRALFARRPDDILRGYVTDQGPGGMRRFGDLLRALAATHRPYKVVPPEELERITESKHHEGICLVARPRPVLSLESILSARSDAPLVALADVSNPHNVGAILRIAAHFGAGAVLLEGEEGRLSPAALRTAQGGGEWVDTLFVPELEGALRLCRERRFTVCATSSHEGRDLFAGPLPARAVVLLGSEGEGLPTRLLERADLTLSIPGTGHVESLNVATAASVILAELWRQHARPA